MTFISLHFTVHRAAVLKLLEPIVLTSMSHLSIFEFSDKISLSDAFHEATSFSGTNLFAHIINTNFARKIKLSTLTHLKW